MKDLPFSIGVISFVAGLVLLIAAIAGQKIEIAAVKLPEIVDSKRRFVVGALGAVLIGFGMWDGTLPVFLRPSAAGLSAATAPQAASGLPGGSVAMPGLLACLADVPADDIQIIPVETDLRTDRKFSARQPKDGLLGIQFTGSGKPLGAVRLQTLASGLGFRILGVVDANCAPVSAYSNVTAPGAVRNAVANLYTVEYRFPVATVRMDTGYCEGRDCISLRAQRMGP
ncbi:MAG: hypothetical protein ABIV92_01390 [Thermoflexales bacterium]